MTSFFEDTGPATVRTVGHVNHFASVGGFFVVLPGLDYSVFNSLGPYVGHVKRVQMELHEHASQNL